MRRGIEQGEYVYQRGDLRFGPGDPPAGIEMDEQSMIFTMAWAKNMGLWPRQPVEPPTTPAGSAVSSGIGEHPSDGGPRVREPKPPPYRASGTAPGSFTAEGILREALVRLREQARAKNVEAIAVLTIRMFEAGDAFRLLGAVAAVSGADRVVTIAGGYETRDGGTFVLDFRGPVPDVQPIREFLEPQLRAASSANLQTGFESTFEGGLSMKGEAAKKLTERLSRFASGAALCVGHGGGQGVNGAAGTHIRYRDPGLRATVRAARAPSRAGGRRIRDLATSRARLAARDLCDTRRRATRAQSRAGGVSGTAKALAGRRQARAARRCNEAGLCADRRSGAGVGAPVPYPAPMRSRSNVRAVAEGVEAMGREEVAYWLGMAMHRKHPGRVLTALRCLLAEPRK